MGSVGPEITDPHSNAPGTRARESNQSGQGGDFQPSLSAGGVLIGANAAGRV